MAKSKVECNISLKESIPQDSWWPGWLSWRPTSQVLLYLSEVKLFGRLRSYIESFYVPVLDNTSRLRTIIAMSAKHRQIPAYKSRTPIVLVHGMGAGVGFWCKNLDHLAEHRPVYAMDVLGFGRSSRVTFPNDAEGAENLFIQSLEDWRAHLKLDKFVLVGHSLGGYLVYSYAIKHPEKVSHLILVDPWGFPERSTKRVNSQRGFLIRSVASVLSYFNPLSIVRVSGPFGPMLIRRFRQDLDFAFTDAQTNSEKESQSEQEIRQAERPQAPGWLLGEMAGEQSELANAGQVTMRSSLDQGSILDYIYHCNAQSPSGEVGFKSMSYPIGWAQRPMLKRVADLNPNVPVTFIYGGRSWMDSQSGLTARYLRSDAYTDVRVIDGAGHHVYAQGDLEFNSYVNSICQRVDSGQKFEPGNEPGGPMVIERGVEETLPSPDSMRFHSGGSTVKKQRYQSETSSEDN